MLRFKITGGERDEEGMTAAADAVSRDQLQRRKFIACDEIFYGN